MQKLIFFWGFYSGRSISQDGRRDLDRIAMTLVEQDE